MSKGAKDGFRGNQYSNKVVNPQSEDLPKDNRTVTRIAKEAKAVSPNLEKAVTQPMHTDEIMAKKAGKFTLYKHRSHVNGITI